MRRESIAAALLLAALVALLPACSGRKGMANASSTADVKQGEYPDALSRWSGHDKAYEKLETRLIVSATWKTGAFREAYADEYARRYLLSDAERDELKRREYMDGESYHEFFFAAYTPESRWNDFSKRDSIWKIRLYDEDGNFVDPLVVTKVKNDDPKLHAFYPYFTLWTKGYVVKFPKSGLASAPKSVRLQFASALGAAEIEYDGAGASAPAPVRVENVTPTASAPAPAPAP